jgi:L-ascorbate metabolism protein UlaG (beta-lactamase superfamily)
VKKNKKRRWRIVLRGFVVAVLFLFLGLMISTERFVAFGAAPDEATLARMRASPHFKDGQFVNDDPTTLMKVSSWESGKRWLGGDEMRVPTCPLPIAGDAAARVAAPPSSGLRITWLGHSTTLVEIDGARILTDPNWSERSSPSRWVGPVRFHPPPIAIADLPPIDGVVVSHEHFDHLDMATVRALAAKGIPFHVALGVGAHLALWGVPRAQIREHDWWEKTTLPNGIELLSTPARHFNGRGVPGRTGALWTSWSIVGPHHRVYFSGDTGLTKGFETIAERVGPFDVALLEIGQFSPDWGDIHLGPRGAIEATKMLRAKRLFPIHWGTFNLAYHAWSEPAETLFLEAPKQEVPLLTPRIGEPIEPTTDPPTSAWWRSLPPIASRCP